MTFSRNIQNTLEFWLWLIQCSLHSTRQFLQAEQAGQFFDFSLI